MIGYNLFVVVAYASVAGLTFQILFPVFLSFWGTGFIQFIQFLPITLMGLAFGSIFAWLCKKREKYISIYAGCISPSALISILLMSQITNFYLMLAVSMIPFIFVGATTTLGLSALKLPNIYLWELSGAALGIILTLSLLGPISGESIILLLLAAQILYLALTTKAKSTQIILIIAGFFSLGVVGFDKKLNFLNVTLLTNPAKTEFKSHELATTITQEQGELVSSRWSLMSKVDAIKVPYFIYSDYHWVRRESKKLDNSKSSQGLYFNNYVFSIASKNKHRWYKDKTIYGLFDSTKVLLVGVGGGDDVLMHIKNGAKTVLGAEINSAAFFLMKNDLKKVSKEIYDQADIRNIDGRSLLERSNGRFDIIDIAAPSGVAATYHLVHIENYLVTKEAFRDYFKHLNENGLIRIEIFTDARTREEASLIMNTLRSVYEEMGKNYEGRIVTIDKAGEINKWGYQPFILLAKLTPFSKNQIEFIKTRSSKHFNWQLNSNIKLVEDQIDPSNQLTDNKPFLFAKEFFKARQKGICIFLIFCTIGLLALYSATTRLNPAKLLKSENRFGLLLAAGLCMLSGSYGAFQVWIIQSNSIYLGHPMWSASSVILGMLVGGCLGLILNQKFNDRKIAIFAALVILSQVICLAFIRYRPVDIGQLLRISYIFIVSLGIGYFSSPIYSEIIKKLNSIDRGMSALVVGVAAAAMILAQAGSVYLSYFVGFNSAFIANLILALLMFISVILFVKMVRAKQVN